jgi:hypothetical protein
LSRSRAAGAVVVALWLGACTKAPAPRVASPLSPGALRGASTPSAAVSPAPSTAAQVVARFTAAGLAVGTYTEFLAGHDPNPPLGIPGIYAGATWHDATLRPPADDTALGFEDGGTVEVFTTPTEREARQQAFAALPANGGTVVGRGPYLMLLSPLLAPGVVTRYTTALPAS